MIKKTTISISIIALLIGGVLGSNYLTDNPNIDPTTINPVSVNYTMAAGGDIDIAISITGDETTKTQLIDAFALVYEYQEEIEQELDGEITMISNPETKEQFFNRMVIEYLENVFEAGIKEQVNISATDTFENAKINKGNIKLKK